MFCIKVSLKSKVIGILEFSSSREREVWLLKAGFVDDHLTWYHPFTKEVAGLFISSPDQEIEKSPLYEICDNRSTHNKRSFWDVLIR
jgi:hypothetical protein